MYIKIKKLKFIKACHAWLLSGLDLSTSILQTQKCRFSVHFTNELRE